MSTTPHHLWPLTLTHPNPSRKPDPSTDPKGDPRTAWPLFLGHGQILPLSYSGMRLPGSSSVSPKPKNWPLPWEPGEASRVRPERYTFCSQVFPHLTQPANACKDASRREGGQHKCLGKTPLAESWGNSDPDGGFSEYRCGHVREWSCEQGCRAKHKNKIQ